MTDNKAPKIDNAQPESETTPDDSFDPADAFARVSPEQVPGKRAGKGAKKKGAREPALTVVPDRIVDEEDVMDPLDAAKEITKMADQIFGLVAHFRGYAAMQLPDGSSVLAMAAPTDADKLRFEKALARLMKSSGAQMSPGAQVAFVGFTCYLAPIAALEIARAASRPKAAPHGQ